MKQQALSMRESACFIDFERVLHELLRALCEISPANHWRFPVALQLLAKLDCMSLQVEVSLWKLCANQTAQRQRAASHQLDQLNDSQASF